MVPFSLSQTIRTKGPHPAPDERPRLQERISVSDVPGHLSRFAGNIDLCLHFRTHSGRFPGLCVQDCRQGRHASAFSDTCQTRWGTPWLDRPFGAGATPLVKKARHPLEDDWMPRLLTKGCSPFVQTSVSRPPTRRYRRRGSRIRRSERPCSRYPSRMPAPRRRLCATSRRTPRRFLRRRTRDSRRRRR